MALVEIPAESQNMLGIDSLRQLTCLKGLASWMHDREGFL
jgi:hypothetical protein